MSIAVDVLRWVGRALGDLERFVRDEAGWRDLTTELGWSAVPLPPAISALATPVAEVIAAIENVDPSPAAIERVRQAVVDAVDAVEALSTIDLGAAGMGADLAEAAIDLVVLSRLSREHPIAHAVLVVVGFVEVRYVREPPRPGFHRRRLRWDNLAQLLDRPSAAWTTVFGWGTDAFDAKTWTSAITELLGASGIDAAVERLPPDTIDRLADEGLAVGVPVGCTIRLVDATSREIGGRVVAVRDGGVDGVALLPIVRGELTTTVPLRDRLALEVQAGGALDGVGVIVIRSDGDVSASGMAGLDAGLRVVLRWTFAPRAILALDDTHGLWASGVELAGAITTTSGFEVALELAWIDGRLRTSSADGDGFVASVVPSIDVPLDARLAWSNRRGLHLRGAGALALVIPIDRRIGPARLRTVELALTGGDRRVALRAGVSASVELGPVTASIGGLGVEAVAARGAAPRSAGALDIDVHPTWPTEIGLAIEGPLVSGSGMLGREAHRYFGAATLRIAGYDARAAGVIDTSDGGFSLAVMAMAATPRIPIGLGFTLDGLGGFVALHRRFDDAACREGLASGVVSRLLAPPPEPGVELGAIEQLAPIARGRHVLGPLVRLGWGTPRLAAADVAVLIEVPAPIRIVLLGAIRIGLPTLDKPVVDLRLDALGVLDLGRGTLAIDASLHDSTIVGYAITGDMAVRIGWLADPQFLISIGGFHPAFRPPAGFPTPRRLQLVVGDNPQLTVAGYLAVTSNTAQFGARADLIFKGGGFEIAGNVQFDALFEFSPFHFEIDIAASASIKYRSIRLASVKLEFVLSGPRPWHAAGEATFGVLWWDVSVGFDVTWGDATPIALPPPPDIAAALRTALARRESWSTALPAGEPAWIALRSDTTTAVRVHPLGLAVVRQQVVPLRHDITQFGSIPLAAAQRFAIDHVRLGTSSTALVAPAVEDRFAPGQFTQLETAERLSAPAFEQFTSGVELGANELDHGASARVAMEVATRVFDPLAPSTKPPIRAVDVAIVRGARATQARPTSIARGPRVADLDYVLASMENLAITAEGAAIGRGAQRYASLREALRVHRASRRRLQVIPRIETPNHGDRVIVVREDDNLRNIDFVDTRTGEAMTREQFVAAIHANKYPGYAVRMIRGLATPVARPNASTDDNLG